MGRVFNFSAGPSMLPLPVLKKIQKDLPNYQGLGCGVMEMSHRSKMYEPIHGRAEESLRRLMDIPPDYAVLFLQGGATLQFSTVPMNLALRSDSADYLISGEFAQKAFEESRKWLKPRAVASSADKKFTALPKVSPEMIDPRAKYVHITVNNTIYGTMYSGLPATGGVPLVGDMSSIILGKDYPVRDFGLIYAGAQKNIGPAGLTVVIVRRSLLGETDPLLPPVLSYKAQDAAQSMVNTPPTFAVYVAGLIFDWLLDLGGVAEMQKINEEKARLLYETIDNSRLFSAPAEKEARSIMNAVFTLKDVSRTEEFLKMAEGRSLINLKGHRSVGGCRASIYNAVPLEAVQALCGCLRDFEAGKKA